MFLRFLYSMWAFFGPIYQTWSNKNIGDMQVVENSTQVEWPWVGPHFLFWWSSATSTPTVRWVYVAKPPRLVKKATENFASRKKTYIYIYISLPLIQGLIHQRYCFFSGKNNPNWLSFFFQMAWNHQPVLFVTPFFWLFNNRLFFNSQRIKDFAERNSGAKAQGEAEPEKVPWQSVGWKKWDKFGKKWWFIPRHVG